MRPILAVLAALTFTGCAAVTPQSTRDAYAPVRMVVPVPFDAGWDRAVVYSRNCYASAAVSADRSGNRGTIGARVNEIIIAQLFVMDLRGTHDGTEIVIYGMYADHVKGRLPDWMLGSAAASCAG